MGTSLDERIARVKELLRTARHAALATVNADGSPHNTPVFATWDDHLSLYWASGQQTQHSQNIATNGRACIVVFDSFEAGGGLYVDGEAEALDGTELVQGLEIVNANRRRWQREIVDISLYQGNSPQRLYRATCLTAWVNLTEYDASGEVLREYRHQIAAADLR